MMYGGFASVYDRLMDDVDYEAWCAYLVSRYSASGVLPPARVLDAVRETGVELVVVPWDQAAGKMLVFPGASC